MFKSHYMQKKGDLYSNNDRKSRVHNIAMQIPDSIYT